MTDKTLVDEVEAAEAVSALTDGTPAITKLATPNILSGDYDNTTITKAINLVDKLGEDFSTWKSKELGLQLVLLGLAEIQSLRVSKLAGLVFRMEQEVFSESRLRELDTRKLIDLYRLGVGSLNESAQYIRGAISTVDWPALEAQLVELTARGETDATKQSRKDISQVAGTLLDEIVKMRPPSETVQQ